MQSVMKTCPDLSLEDMKQHLRRSCDYDAYHEVQPI
jgi:hypothetical protein